MSTFKQIRSDIVKCDEVINSSDIEKGKNLVNMLSYSYKAYITDITDGLHFFSPVDNGRSLNNDEIISDLKAIKHRLLLYIETQKHSPKTYKPSQPASINITSNNNLNVSISIDVLFERAEEAINNNTSLTNDETKEALEKLDELRGIEKDNSNKKEKWRKLGTILKWTSGRGLDLALKIIPIVLKILEM